MPHHVQFVAVAWREHITFNQNPLKAIDDVKVNSSQYCQMNVFNVATK